MQNDEVLGNLWCHLSHRFRSEMEAEQVLKFGAHCNLLEAHHLRFSLFVSTNWVCFSK